MTRTAWPTTKFVVTAVALAVCLLTARSALAEQRVVVGFGGGPHNFGNTDEFRKSTALVEVIDDARMLQIYLEWYFTDRWGIGLRSNAYQGAADFDLPSSASGDALQVTLNATLATVNFIAAGAEPDSGVRLGFLVGGGPVRYSVENVEKADCNRDLVTFLPFLIFTCIDTAIDEVHVDGSATFGGVFLDLGGDGFGIRLGANAIETDIKPLLKTEVDGAGVQFYLDFRYDFT